MCGQYLAVRHDSLHQNLPIDTIHCYVLIKFDAMLLSRNSVIKYLKDHYF